MKISFLATSNPIFSVSFKHIDDENVQPMLRTLAWQWTLDNVDYSKVRLVLSKKETYVLPDNKVAKLVVVPQLVLNGKTFDPDTDSLEVRNGGKLKGCYMAAMKSVNLIPDPDLAAEFVIRLSQVEELWDMVEDGKKLPETEPKPPAKNGKKAAKAKPAKPDDDDDEDEKPRIKIKPKKPQPEPDEFDDDDIYEEAEFDEDDAEAEADEAEEDAESSLTELWKQLNGDGIGKRLSPMSFGAREKLYRDLKAEHDEAAAETEAFIAQARQAVSDNFAWLKYIATAIADFNGPQSAAYEILEKPKITVRSRTDGKDGQKRQGKDQQKQQRTQGTEDQKQQKPQGKQGQPQSDEAANKEANYINRRLKKTNKLLARAEQEGADTKIIDLLEEMVDALKDKDTEEYNSLWNEYLNLMSGDDSSSGSDGSDSGSGSDKGDTGAGSDSSSDDSSTGDTGSDDSEGEDEPQGESDPEDEDDGYTIADILATLALSGYTTIPKPFKIMAKGSRVTAESANAVLKQYGIDLTLE